MYGAAAVAASDAKALSASYHALRLSDAEASVAATASPTRIDLHFITAADAKHIAVKHARAWWEALGEEKVGPRPLPEDKWFVVIVGKGLHSAARRAVVGPAVVKALEEDGWKIEGNGAATGMVVVKGRKRRV
jgi:hypothetical protein